MTGQTIIDTFELYGDDSTELSSQEELDLANKIYLKVLSNRPWRFLKKLFSGTHTAGVVTLPADFWYIPIFEGRDDTGEYGQEKVVMTVNGTTVKFYKVINFEDQLNYINQSNVCWIDLAANTLVFAYPPTDSSVKFFYIYQPDLLAVGTSPVFKSPYHYIIAHGMIPEDMSYQLFDKNRAYSSEHQAKYEQYLTDLAWYDSQFYSQ